MKKHSTGALRAEEKEAQDEKYRTLNDTHAEYDYVFIGTGNASLTCAALLAKSGARICMLEAHDAAGGYAHTFKVGDYSFCAQVHYIWSCHPGGRVYEFVKRLNLQDKISFTAFDADGYDHMIMPDGKRIKIPYGWDRLEKNIFDAYPSSTGVSEFLGIVKNIRTEMKRLPRRVNGWDIWLKGLFYPKLRRYRNATVQDVFDECNVSVEARTVLCAQAGDFLLPPEKLSMLFYTGLLAGYGTGAYAPTHSFGHYIDQVVSSIESAKGDIFFEEAVTDYVTDGDKINSVRTSSGKTFKARNFICGADPQATAELIGLQHFSRRYRAKLNYDYSDSGVMVYLGMKPSFVPGKYGLGNHNTWHCLDWDMNKMWRASELFDLDHSWFFMSTPDLHDNREDDRPHTIELGTYVPYKPFQEAASRDHAEYLQLKHSIADAMIKQVEKYHVPDLQDHISIKLVGSPMTNKDFCGAPQGNAYGAEMTPNSASSRLGARTPFRNLYWCNATSGLPGFYGTVTTGMDLYMDLTGDNFFDAADIPSDEELINDLLEAAQAGTL